jgi:hypothetical protein
LTKVAVPVSSATIKISTGTCLVKLKSEGREERGVFELRSFGIE